MHSVPDAALLVATEQAEAFHLCISQVVAGGVELPCLGVFVGPDTIEIDYQMGKDWGPTQVAGFFELLDDCCSLDFSTVVKPADFDGPPTPEQFLLARALLRNQCDDRHLQLPMNTS